MRVNRVILIGGGAVLLAAAIVALILSSVVLDRHVQNKASCKDFAGAYAEYQATQCPENKRVVRSPAADVRDADAKNIVLFADESNLDDTVVDYLLHKSPKAKLRWVYLTGDAWGNAGVAFANTFKIHHLFGKDMDIPVVAGSLASLNDSATGQLDYLQAVGRGKGGLIDSDNMWSTAHMLTQGPRYYEFLNDLTSDAPESPADFIGSPVSILALKQFLFSSSDRFTFVVTGPLTPIVHLFQNLSSGEVTQLTARVERVVVMGGSIDVPGNVFSRPPFAANFCNLSDPYYSAHGAEFSVYLDPHAAQLAFQYLNGASIPVTLVPLDATDGVPHSEVLINALHGFDTAGAPYAPGPQTPEAQVVGQLLRNFQKSWFTTGANEHCFFDGQWTPSCCFYSARGGAAFIWDPTALLAALYPSQVIVNQTSTSIYVQRDNPAFDWSTPGQGSTNRCDPMLRSDCVTVNVVYTVNATAIYGLIYDLLQSPINSAVRQLYCTLP